MLFLFGLLINSIPLWRYFKVGLLFSYKGTSLLTIFKDLERPVIILLKERKELCKLTTYNIICKKYLLSTGIDRLFMIYLV